MDYQTKYFQYSGLSAKMVGYFGAKAIYDVSIPLQARKEILEFIIDVHKDIANDSILVQGWIEEWEKNLKEIST